MSPTPQSQRSSAGLVWYAAYGSNMHAARMACYVAGGTPPGSARSNPGCRDRTAPRRTVPVMLPGGIYFALSSTAWGGGVAFYDPALPGEVPGRAYLLSAGQFSDLLAQEMHRPPEVDLDLAPVSRTDRQRVGPGCYETLVRVAALDGHPVLTFTAPDAAGDVPTNAPSAAYLRVLGLGLVEAHGWSAERAATYLCGRPGVAGTWDVPTVAALLAEPESRSSATGAEA